MASLAACASKEEAEAQFEKLVQFVQEAIQFMPNYRSSFLCDLSKETYLWAPNGGSVINLIKYNETPCEALPTHLSQLQTSIII